MEPNREPITPASPTERRSSAPQARPHTMRWVLAHEPPVVFDDASEELAALVREGTAGEIDVELSMSAEFATSRGAETISRTELVRCLQRGEIEMAHVYVAALGAFHDPLWAMELPFLFSDYEHAERFFEGPVARELMDGLVPLGLRGLSFAYSGGFRIVPTVERELRSVEDYAGLTLRTSGNPIPEALYEALGARALGADLDAIAPMTRQGEIAGAEITYVRFAATGLDEVFEVVNETQHSLFTTMMVVNERWFRGLPERHQEVIFEAGRSACRTERRTAIAQEAKTKAAFEARGMPVVRMSPERQAELRQVASSVTERFVPRFGEALIEGMRSA